jgi:DNA-binding transcriptional ArsR family regulator
MFRAFSDSIRLQILSLVQPGELCVCDLVEILRLPQPTISRHLSYLRRARLVKVRQERSWNYYERTALGTVSVGRLIEVRFENRFERQQRCGLYHLSRIGGMPSGRWPTPLAGSGTAASAPAWPSHRALVGAF